jgi:hypothetical protein
MRGKDRQSALLLAIALPMLVLRALTPDGYMPGSRGSGLLFELCPAGMPTDIMRALGRGGHHHHGDEQSASGTEQCPIGHMLSAAVAVDDGIVATPHLAAPLPEPGHITVHFAVRTSAYRSRAPPA